MNDDWSNAHIALLSIYRCLPLCCCGFAERQQYGERSNSSQMLQYWDSRYCLSIDWWTNLQTRVVSNYNIDLNWLAGWILSVQWTTREDKSVGFFRSYTRFCYLLLISSYSAVTSIYDISKTSQCSFDHDVLSPRLWRMLDIDINVASWMLP